MTDEEIRQCFILAGRPVPTDEQIEKLWKVVQKAQLCGSAATMQDLLRLILDPTPKEWAEALRRLEKQRGLA